MVSTYRAKRVEKKYKALRWQPWEAIRTQGLYRKLVQHHQPQLLPTRRQGTRKESSDHPLPTNQVLLCAFSSQPNTASRKAISVGMFRLMKGEMTTLMQSSFNMAFPMCLFTCDGTLAICAANPLLPAPSLHPPLPVTL